MLAIAWNYRLARILCPWLRWTAPKLWKDKTWQVEWSVESDQFPPQVRSEFIVYPFLNLLAADWTWTSVEGHKLTYHLVGAVAGTNKLTARWFDPESEGYFGALQVVVSPLRNEARGIWIGFSANGSVKAGDVRLFCRMDA